jgi:hypothetical protein
MLLGTRVAAGGTLDWAEHHRRAALGAGAVTDQALLERLLNLPAGAPVHDHSLWGEAASWPGGAATRAGNGQAVTRLLEPVLRVDQVVVAARPGRGVRAVQDASLFAGYSRRWVALPSRRVPDTVAGEARLCGVGLLDPGGQVLLEAEPPRLRVDGWVWLLWEQAYRRWLTERSQDGR